MSDPVSPGPDRVPRDILDTAGGVSPVLAFTLAPGDELHIDFRSHGCFHNIAFALRLVRDSLGASVTVTKTPSGLAPGWRLEPLRRLTPQQLDSLDRLFAFYRRNSATGCTTVDTIAVLSIEGGVTRRESFVDGSCATFEGDSLWGIGHLLPLVRDTQGRAAVHER